MKKQLIEVLKTVKFTKQNLDISKLVLVFNIKNQNFRLVEVHQSNNFVDTLNESGIAEFYNSIRATKNYEEKINSLADEYIRMIKCEGYIRSDDDENWRKD